MMKRVEAIVRPDSLEAVKDLEKKQVLDAFTCVECGRCQMNCPAYATGKALNPKPPRDLTEKAYMQTRTDEDLVGIVRKDGDGV